MADDEKECIGDIYGQQERTDEGEVRKCDTQ